MNKLPSKYDWFDENFLPPQPWNPKDRPSLFSFVSENLQPKEISGDWDKQILPATLPDEDFFYNNNDAAFQYWPDAGTECLVMNDPALDDDEYVVQLMDSLYDAFSMPSLTKVTVFYNIINAQPTLHCALAVYEALSTWNDEDLLIVTAIAQWLALTAPDRNAVKFGLMILMLFPFEGDDYIFEAYSKHEDFAPYCHQRLLGQYDSGDLSQKQLEEKIIALYKSCAGYGRYYILFNTINDNHIFDDLMEKLFFIGPPFRWANAETSFLLVQNVNLEEFLDQKPLDQVAYQSILLILKNLLLPDGRQAAEIFDIPNSLTLLEKVYNRIDDVDFNITKICLLQRIYDCLEQFANDVDTHKFLNQIGWEIDRIKAIHQCALESKVKHLKDWKSLVREHIDTNGPDFPRMVNHMVTQLDMQEETGGSRVNAMKFLRLGNNIMRDIALYKAENQEQFLEAVNLIYSNTTQPEDWNSKKQFITELDKEFCAALDVILDNIALFPESIKDSTAEQIIIDSLNAPNLDIRCKVLDLIKDYLKPYWTSNIKEKLENMAFTEPEDELKKFVKDLIRNKLRIFRR